MVKERMTVNGPEGQGYVWYGRVTVNGETARSPFMTLTEGDVITLRRFNTERMADADILTKIYQREVDNGKN